MWRAICGELHENVCNQIYLTQAFVLMDAQNSGDDKDKRTRFRWPSFGSSTLQQSHTSTHITHAHKSHPHTKSPYKTLSCGSVRANGGTVSVGTGCGTALVDTHFWSRGWFCMLHGVTRALSWAESTAHEDLVGWLVHSWPSKMCTCPVTSCRCPCLLVQSLFLYFPILHLQSPLHFLAFPWIIESFFFSFGTGFRAFEHKTMIKRHINVLWSASDLFPLRWKIIFIPVWRVSWHELTPDFSKTVPQKEIEVVSLRWRQVVTPVQLKLLSYSWLSCLSFFPLN